MCRRTRAGSHTRVPFPRGSRMQKRRYRFQGTETDALDLARLQQRQVGHGDADFIGQVGQLHLALDQY